MAPPYAQQQKTVAAETRALQALEAARESGRSLQPQAQAALAQLRAAVAIHRRNRQERADQQVKFRREIKKTVLIVAVIAVAVAALADLLSLVDLGWVISWIIPLVSWVMARRVQAIRNAMGRIDKAIMESRKRIMMLRQRLAPILAAMNRRDLLTQSIAYARFEISSYIKTFIRDTIITQLVELIPVVDAILPLYLGQVIKLIIEQNIAYQKAHKLLITLDRMHLILNQLEQTQITYLTRQVNDIVTGRTPQTRISGVTTLRTPQRVGPRSSPQNISRLPAAV